jgi:hypothetical protein
MEVFKWNLYRGSATPHPAIWLGKIRKDEVKKCPKSKLTFTESGLGFSVNFKA